MDPSTSTSTNLRVPVNTSLNVFQRQPFTFWLTCQGNKGK